MDYGFGLFDCFSVEHNRGIRDSLAYIYIKNIFETQKNCSVFYNLKGFFKILSMLQNANKNDNVFID